MNLGTQAAPRASNCLVILEDTTPIYEKIQAAFNLSDENLETLKSAVRESRATDVQNLIETGGIIRQNRLNSRRSRLISRLGDGGEALVRNAEARIRALLSDSEIYIAVPEHALEPILESGKIKSTFELRNNRFPGRDTEVSTQRFQNIRQVGEEDMFGFDPQFPAEQRPISAFFADSLNAEEAQHALRSYSSGVRNPANDLDNISFSNPRKYSIALKVNRNRTAGRVTFTGDDALFPDIGYSWADPNYDQSQLVSRLQPSLISEPNISSVIPLSVIDGSAKYRGDLSQLPNGGDIEHVRSFLREVADAESLTDLHHLKEDIFTTFGDFGAYFEAQIHGQVNLEDISTIVFYAEKRTDIPQELIELVEGRGLRYEISTSSPENLN